MFKYSQSNIKFETMMKFQFDFFYQIDCTILFKNRAHCFFFLCVGGIGNCTHRTQYKNTLPRHRRAKHGDIIFECCEQTFPTKGDLDTHLLNE